MIEREQVEARIRQVMADEKSGISLSNKLFTPDGLFNQIAKTEEDRRQVAQSPLFREAQRRVRELERLEIGELSRAADQLKSKLPGATYRIRIEPGELPDPLKKSAS
jgi:hypothetical protein